MNLTSSGGQKSGAVSSFSLDAATGTMTQLSQQPSKGGSPCNVTTDHTGSSVFAANYTGGSAISFTPCKRQAQRRCVL